MDCGFSDQKLLVRFGPTVSVDIGFDPEWKLGGSHPRPGIAGVHALVDTGATESCIDNLLAADLNLPIVDRKSVAGISGANTFNVYMAQVHVPAIPFTIYGMFTGVDLKKGGQVHSALLGRTFLQRFEMTYNGMTGAVQIEQSSSGSSS